MRHICPHRWLLHLALAAAMLMVLLPSLGRLAGGGPAANPHAVHAGSHGGHATHSPGLHAGTPAPATPHSGGTGQYDCGYCPLLASLVPPAAVAPVFGSLLHDRLAALSAHAPRVAWRHPWGLGSRGPPAA